MICDINVFEIYIYIIIIITYIPFERLIPLSLIIYHNII